FMYIRFGPVRTLRHLFPQGSQLPSPFCAMQNRSKLIHEVVTRGAGHPEAFVQYFIGGKDLLDDNPGLVNIRTSQSHGFAQSFGVLQWLCQTVYMVNAQTVNQTLLIQTHWQLVHGIKDFGIFDTYTNQTRNLKKATPVDTGCSVVPVTQAIILLEQQLFQALTAFRRP